MKQVNTNVVFTEEGKVVYADGTVYDEKHNKIGYEVPFTRIFYKFVEPRKSEEIFEEFKKLSEEEQELMKKILGE